MMYEDTTIAAITTAPGEGGIGIIRVSGNGAKDVGDQVFQMKSGKTFASAQPQRMYYGHIRGPRGIVDEGLGVYMQAPHSYTGEDVVELQIHGSREALRETLALCLSAGAIPAERGEFTKRAFLNGRIDLTQAEAVMDVITARGSAALSQAESHLSGALSRYVQNARSALKNLITKIEVTIDYPEEDIEDMTREEILEGLAAVKGPMEALLARSKKGRIIREGMRTAIVGRPNAGKSSLLNAILQEDRAIVTDVPGTTRDTIEEAVQIGGVPLVLMDTAGLRHTDNQVERIGIERARSAMEKADLILAVIDESRPLQSDDKEILTSLQGRQAIVILNKCDLPQEVRKEDIAALAGSVPVISLSARYGSGIDDLEAALARLAESQNMESGRELFLTNVRHVELVRKALLAVDRAQSSCEIGMPADCVAVDLTESWNLLGEITGDTVDDELIHSIFENFCVGK